MINSRDGSLDEGQKSEEKTKADDPQEKPSGAGELHRGRLSPSFLSRYFEV